MSIKRVFAVSRLNALLQAQEPSAPMLMTLIPIMLTPFMIPGNRATLISEGYPHATGAEQAVPGFAILFSFFSVQLIVQMFFDERVWGTWDRMRVSPASMAEIIGGKIVVAFAMQLVQMSVVMAAGMLIFGYRPDGSMLALGLIAVAFCAMLVIFGVVVSLWSHSERVALSVSMLAGVLMACLGGSLTAVSTFPAWAQPLAKFSPAYWAVDAIKRIGLDHAGVLDILPQFGVIVAFGVVFAILVIAGFRRISKDKA